jgi:flagellar M-ring protein FliF
LPGDPGEHVVFESLGGTFVQGLVEFVKTLGATRIAAMAAVAVALIGFFAFIILRMSAPQMSVLYSDLALDDSSAVVKELERQGVPYTARNEGSLILVPKEVVTRLRMKLAEANIPKGGGIGYEIFDKSDALGATSFVQNINHLRALEGELSRTIRAIDRIQAARVHLVLPERALFSRDKPEPSASIVLKLRGSLDGQQVRAIRHLVASAVKDLKPTRVSVVDENGRLLADGADDQTQGFSLSADERKVAYERRLRDQVEQIVSSVVGPGRARVQLTADFDFNRVTQTSDRFDPESRVVRSSQTREESAQSADGRDNQVTVGNELPSAQAAQQGAGNQRQDQSKKSEEIVNYEISRTTKTEVIEGGRVNRISVAVLVDGNYTRNPQGQLVYAPREASEIDRIAALVRSAIGFDQKRGDQVEVVNLRLAETPPATAGEPRDWLERLALTKEDIMRGVEMMVMLLLGLVVLFFVVRPLVRRIITPENAKDIPAVDSPALVPGGPNVALVGAEQAVQISNHASAMIDIAQVQGQVHAQTVEKVGQLAEKNPHETVAIIRQWLHDTP